METLTKENFWNEMEQKYPKAMAHFKLWSREYKRLNDWDELFNDFPAGTSTDCDIEFKAPSFFEVPIAMQFGIYLEYTVYCTTDRLAFHFEINTGYSGRNKFDLAKYCRSHTENIMSHLEGRI
jgi:hypothetical protein